MSLEQPRIRVAAIIVRDRALLLVRHIKDAKTYWLLPGGGIEFGESGADALVRELKEETGLDVRPRDLVFVNDSIPPDKHRHVLNLYFTADALGGELTLGQDKRLAEIRFTPFDELPKLTFYPDIRNVLLPALRQGFPRSPQYLGNLWQDD